MLIYISSNQYPWARFTNSSKTWVASWMDFKTDWTEYFYLKDINEQLSQENATLKNQLKESYYQKHKGKSIIKDTSFQLQYYHLPARVINYTTNKQDNFLTINRGSLDGIQPEMGVVSNNAVVGFVKDVSEHYATVISVLNRKFKLRVRLKKSKDYGLISWDGGRSDIVILNDIPVDVSVKKGDTVTTRGASSRFPDNIIVGTVEEVDNSSGNMLMIKVKLACNFSSVYYVNVIDNKFKDEQDQLEKKLENKDVKGNNR
jgi:rod shape-determining protein MreC